MKISFTKNQGKTLDKDGKVQNKMNNQLPEVFTDFHELLKHLKNEPKGLIFTQGFFKNGERKKENLESLSLLIFDFDHADKHNYVAIQNTLFRARFKSALYTTTSHTLQNPRFRVIIPLKTEIPRDKIYTKEGKTRPQYTWAYGQVAKQLGFLSESAAKEKGLITGYDEAYSKTPSQSANSGVLLNTGKNLEGLNQDLKEYIDMHRNTSSFGDYFDFEKLLDKAPKNLEKTIESPQKTAGRPKKSSTTFAFTHLLDMVKEGKWWQAKEYLVANALEDDFTMSGDEVLNLRFKLPQNVLDLAKIGNIKLHQLDSTTGEFSLDEDDKEALKKSDFVVKALLKARNTQEKLKTQGLIGGLYFLNSDVLRVVTLRYGEKSVVDYSSKDEFIGLPPEFTNLLYPTSKGLAFKPQAKYLVNDKQIYRECYVLLSPYYRGAIKVDVYPTKPKAFMDGNTLIFNDVNHPSVDWKAFFEGVESKEFPSFRAMKTDDAIKKNIAIMIGRAIFTPYKRIKIPNRLVYCFAGLGGAGKGAIFNTCNIFLTHLKKDLDFYPFGTYITQENTPNFTNNFWTKSVANKKFVEIGEATAGELKKNIHIIKEKTGISTLEVNEKYQDTYIVENDSIYYITSNSKPETLKGYFFDEYSNSINRRFIIIEYNSDEDFQKQIIKELTQIENGDYKGYLKYFYDVHQEELLSQMDDVLIKHRKEQEYKTQDERFVEAEHWLTIALENESQKKEPRAFLTISDISTILKTQYRSVVLIGINNLRDRLKEFYPFLPYQIEYTNPANNRTIQGFDLNTYNTKKTRLNYNKAINGMDTYFEKSQGNYYTKEVKEVDFDDEGDRLL